MESVSNSPKPSFLTLFVDENPDVVNALAGTVGRKWPSFVRFVVGNVFRLGPGIIVTSTNSEGDMSAGLDLQIRNRFPSLQQQLERYIRQLPSKDVQYVLCRDGNVSDISSLRLRRFGLTIGNCEVGPVKFQDASETGVNRLVAGLGGLRHLPSDMRGAIFPPALEGSEGACRCAQATASCEVVHNQ